MEFLLVPLLAIAVVTFCIYKVAELLFHIRLSGKLLLMLVVFAWLISLVLPGLFFHSAGFLGSVSVSFISAAGFAWLAATYDVRVRASSAISAVHFSDSASELLPGSDSEGKMTMEAKPDLQADAVLAPAVLPLAVPVDPSRVSTSLSAGTVASGLDVIISDEAETASAECLGDEDLPPDEGFPMETVFEEPLPEYPIVRPAVHRQEPIQDRVTAEAAGMDSAEMEIGERPASDSLEDLLEFAFAQRERHRENNALETFRLIKHLYSDSDAFPMVVAEIVSTLQSKGDYAGASAELTASLQLPEIRQREHLVRIFEQKLSDIQTIIGHTDR